MGLPKTHSCSRCSMSQICLPLGVNKEELSELEALVHTSPAIQANSPITRQGDAFSQVYAVKSGTFKSTRLDKAGNEHVIGFHLPGELIGLDGIYPEHYSATTTALDTAVVCAMDYEKLSQLCTRIPALQKQLLRLLSRDLYESHKISAENADHTASQKMAQFLNNLSARFELRGYSASSFQLAMSRQDIASHLGLTPETVSRVLKKFKDSGLITINNRHIKLNDAHSLNEIIACENN